MLRYLSFVRVPNSLHPHGISNRNECEENQRQEVIIKKKKKSFVTSVYCVLDNLKNFPRCVFFSNISGAQVFTVDFFNES